MRAKPGPGETPRRFGGLDGLPERPPAVWGACRHAQETAGQFRRAQERRAEDPPGPFGGAPERVRLEKRLLRNDDERNARMGCATAQLVDG